MNNDSDQSKLSRKEREFLARRQEILAAATRLFARKGFHGTAMSEIAREAEFSTGSLYNFFQNKEELYFTLLQEKIGALQSELAGVYEHPAGVEDRLRLFVDTIMSFFETERDFFRIFAEQRSEFEHSAKGQFADVVHEGFRNYLGNMVRLMEEGIREGLLAPYQPAELALSLLGILNGFIFIHINSEASGGVRDKGARVLEIFFQGTRQRGQGEDK